MNATDDERMAYLKTLSKEELEDLYYEKKNKLAELTGEFDIMDIYINTEEFLINEIIENERIIKHHQQFHNNRGA